MKLILQSCLFSTLAAAAGLGVVLVLGRLFWAAGSGVSGILIGVLTAVAVAFWLRFQFRLVTSMVASGLAAAAACFLAISTAELLPPGSTQWMLQGGLYGTCLGLPLAFLLGPIGMFENFLDRPTPFPSPPTSEPKP